MNKAILYGVGVGPGDPELITIKALNAIKKSDVILVPKSKMTNESTALNIVSDYIKDKEIVELEFPMSFDKDKLNQKWNEAAKVVINLLDEGKVLSFITLGDPTVYSTFMYLNKLIKDRYDTEIIPGITSFCACAARANISICEDTDSVAIIPTAVDINDLQKKINTFNTVILMKFRKNFSEIKDFLIKENIISNAVVVEKCTMNEEKIYHSLLDIDEQNLSYFSTMIIKR